MLVNPELSASLMGPSSCMETLPFLTILLDCITPLGMENDEIPDSSITASSEVSAIEAKTIKSLTVEIKKNYKKKIVSKIVSPIQVLHIKLMSDSLSVACSLWKTCRKHDISEVLSYHYIHNGLLGLNCRSWIDQIKVMCNFVTTLRGKFRCGRRRNCGRAQVSPPPPPRPNRIKIHFSQRCCFFYSLKSKKKVGSAAPLPSKSACIAILEITNFFTVRNCSCN